MSKYEAWRWQFGEDCRESRLTSVHGVFVPSLWKFGSLGLCGEACDTRCPEAYMLNLSLSIRFALEACLATRFLKWRFLVSPSSAISVVSSSCPSECPDPNSHPNLISQPRYITCQCIQSCARLLPCALRVRRPRWRARWETSSRWKHSKSITLCGDPESGDLD